MLIIH